VNKKLDILIKGGLIFDGTGSKPFEADIGISGDRIAFINKKSEVRSQKFNPHSPPLEKGGKGGFDRVIEADGLAIAPGFIDTHAHSEFTLLSDPRAEGKICQGITTEINGNCGLSAAPLYGDALKQREGDLREFDIYERWSTFKEYFEILKRGLTLNFVTLVGHGNIRACIVGYKDRRLNVLEKRKMNALLRKSIREGAIGISTGLIYPPGVYSETGELIELCKALSQLYKKSSVAKSPYTPLYHDNPPTPPLEKGGKGGFEKEGQGGITADNEGFGIYTSHMRSEGDHLIESIEEIISIGKGAGVKVHISHIKTSGKKNWHKINNAISLIEKAQKEGIRVTCDRYPYTAASTDLDTLLPSWACEGGIEEELKRLKSLKLRKKIKKEILNENLGEEYWESVTISSVSSDKNRWMEGKSIAYIAHYENSEPIDILFKILVEEKLRVGAIFLSMNEDNLRRFLSLPYVMIGTDSSARSTSGPTYKGKPHPRGFGSFPRFIGRYVRNNGIMSMSEAIQKITMLPAKTFGINKRGIIKEGAFADIVVFDHKKIIDRATFDKPFLRPEGIYYVIVNGSPVIWEERLTGINAGRILKHGK
jgi:N-acyl-D-amino-acid deacylase